MSTDVVIVGAGASGLACAAALDDLGIAAVVLEARPRVGGRILTVRPPGDVPVEAGAQVVHGERAITWRVLESAGLRAEPLPKDLAFGFALRGRRYEAPELAVVGARLPWVVEQELTGTMGVADVADLSPTERELCRAWLSQWWCADADRLTGGGMAAVRDAATSGPTDSELPDGYDLVAHSLAAGVDVRLGEQVAVVAWAPGEAVVASATRSWPCRAVIVTVPPTVVRAGGLRFDPPLPQAKVDACAAIEVGDALTVLLRWPSPATRSGWALAVDPPGGFWRVRAGSTTVQATFKGATTPVARAVADDLVRLSALARQAFPWLGDGPAELQQVVDWGRDPFSLGGYCYPAPGFEEAQRRWAEPVGGTLFFAGDATQGARHPGTVHGALESGLEAAGQVAAALGQPVH